MVKAKSGKFKNKQKKTIFKRLLTVVDCFILLPSNAPMLYLEVGTL